MMEKITNYKLQIASLFFIVLLGAVLRLWNLNTNPSGLTWDEAALGYNAYSILKTGRDEYGKFLPLNFKSFGDYKPGVYIYLDVPFVAIFGLNEWGVRLPSAIFGILFIFITYLIILELFDKRSLALYVALMMAISPLAIQFSRPAFESGLAVFINSLGLLFFLKGLKNSKFFLFSALFFGVSLFTYQASRIFVPILIAGLFFLNRRNIRFNNHIKVSFVIFAALLLLAFFSIFVNGQSSRLSTENFFAYQRSNEQINQISKEDGLSISDIKFQILHGEWFAYISGLAERYLIYFSPKMLFIDGDYSPRHRVPDLGVFYYISAFLIPIGIIYIWKLKNSGASLIFLLLAISSIPAVLSRDLISMVRALNILLPMTILEGAGLYAIFNFFKKFKNYVFLMISIFAVFFLIANLIIFIDRYFVHAPIKYSQGWLYGYREILNYVNSTKNLSKYDHIYITDDYGQPYIYYLFYSKYPPQNFQKQAILDQPSVDVGTVRKIDNIEFRHVYWPKDRGLKNSLFIATKEELPDQDTIPFSQYKILKDVNFLDGTHAFRVVESQ